MKANKLKQVIDSKEFKHKASVRSEYDKMMSKSMLKTTF